VPWSGALNPLAVGGPRRTVPYKKRWEPRAQCERFNATVHPPSSPSRSRGRHCQRRDAPPVPPLLHRLPWLTSSSSSPTVRHPHSLSLSSSYPRMIYLFYPKCKVMYPLDLPLDDLKSTTECWRSRGEMERRTGANQERLFFFWQSPEGRRQTNGPSVCNPSRCLRACLAECSCPAWLAGLAVASLSTAAMVQCYMFVSRLKQARFNWDVVWFLAHVAMVTLHKAMGRLTTTLQLFYPCWHFIEHPSGVLHAVAMATVELEAIAHALTERRFTSACTSSVSTCTSSARRPISASTSMST
jgi:hypothetical protein